MSIGSPTGGAIHRHPAHPVSPRNATRHIVKFQPLSTSACSLSANHAAKPWLKETVCWTGESGVLAISAFTRAYMCYHNVRCVVCMCSTIRFHCRLFIELPKLAAPRSVRLWAPVWQGSTAGLMPNYSCGVCIQRSL